MDATPVSGSDAVPALHLNGAAPDPMAEAVYANYQTFANQLGALCTLLGHMPLPLMLLANKRLQTTSVLILPAGVTAEQAALQSMAHRNDERVIRAALELQQVIAAIHSGH